jgi:hypothetical protein
MVFLSNVLGSFYLGWLNKKRIAGQKFRLKLHKGYMYTF